MLLQENKFYRNQVTGKVQIGEGWLIDLRNKECTDDDIDSLLPVSWSFLNQAWVI
jgi:hypothetical protein